MASGWNLWVWLQCIGVASRCCYKEVPYFLYYTVFTLGTVPARYPGTVPARL